MSVVTRRVAPKRVVQRRRNLINETALANVQINKTLRTVTEKQTLTRVRITGSVVPDGTGAAPKLAMALSIWRNGKEVIPTMTTSERLDDIEPLALILRDAWASNLNTDVGVMLGHRVEIDTKVQRKLDPGDLLVMSFISSGSTNTYEAQLEIGFWFKLA